MRIFGWYKLGFFCYIFPLFLLVFLFLFNQRVVYYLFSHLRVFFAACMFLYRPSPSVFSFFFLSFFPSFIPSVESSVIHDWLIFARLLQRFNEPCYCIYYMQVQLGKCGGERGHIIIDISVFSSLGSFFFCKYLLFLCYDLWYCVVYNLFSISFFPFIVLSMEYYVQFVYRNWCRVQSIYVFFFLYSVCLILCLSLLYTFSRF